MLGPHDELSCESLSIRITVVGEDTERVVLP